MMNRHGRALALSHLALALLACLLIGGTAMAADRVHVSERTPWYWSYRGETVLLLGGSDEDNLFNDPELMADNLDKLAACGGNYIRGTLSWRDEHNVPPFAKAGDKYDLTQFSEEFWGRLETCCREANQRGIIMQIEIWATFDHYRDLWLTNPWNPANNVNYTTQNTKLKTEWPHHPASKPQPFFHSVPKLNNDQVLLGYQQAFVRKVLDVTLPFGNVLYCLDNETHAPAEWALYWGAFIREELAQRGVEANLTEMWNPWDLRDEEHVTTWANPDLFSFCDVSQNNWQVGQTHYDHPIWFRDNLLCQSAGPRPMNNVKIYGRVGSSRGGLDERENIERFWRNIFAGCASARFHRPDSGLGLNDLAQRAIRAARTFTDAFDLYACGPRPDLLTEREDNEAYCLAAPPEVFALYFPAGGEVSLRVGDEVPRRMRVRWFDVNAADFVRDDAVECAGALKLTSPTPDQTWLALIEPQ